MRYYTHKAWHNSLLTFIVSIVSFTVSPAFAQNDFFTLSINQSIESSLLSNSLFQMRMAAGASGGGRSKKTSGTNRSARTASAKRTRNRKTTFKPVTTDIMPEVFAKAVGEAAEKVYRPGAGTDQPYFQLNTPDKLDFMRWLFNYDDREKVGDGLYRYDVAYAAAEMIIQFQYATSGRYLSEKQKQGLRRQMWNFFETNREFQKLSNEKKQRLYETYVLLGKYMYWCYDEASSDANKPITNAVRAAAKNQLERFLGAPMSKIVFTDNGVARR